MSKRMMKMNKISACPPELIAKKTIIIRTDCNVPLDKKSGQIADITRLERIIPTIKFYCDLGAKLVICSHFGRPDGQKIPSMSLKIVADKLSQLMGKEILFHDDCIGEELQNKIQNMPFGQAIMAENLRFYAQEEANDAKFAQSLAKLGDIYVNDAFSCSHRAHASISAITDYLPSFAGPSLLAEIQALESALEHPKRPSVAIVGGAKISTKISVLKFLIAKVDTIIIGGGMANNFYLAQGYDVGKSLVEADAVGLASEILTLAKQKNCRIYCPEDFIIAKEFAANSEHYSANLGDKVDGMILDAGKASIKTMQEICSNAKTLLWNGPLGAFELDPFHQATYDLAKFVAHQTKNGKLISIAGGGDTVSALNNAGVSDDFSYISTAGGAFLEWLEGIELPGIKALRKQQ